ncbi:unnamed protein product [Hydatigera taeniaeformis]|uniref:TRAF-type domain-containing protein n=1 Tax=Hydatigena taeniaeformis TaxID=6205 RepID=A0A0R3WXB3_HYDTA|nr:unnamed protein product [Hydatigera taeniaeformis]
MSVTLEDTYCYKHCRNCIFANCPSQECHVLKCPLNCGHKMHACKAEEHISNVCPLAEVPCISASFGCPRRMRRQFLGHHLLKCPASIVHCTAEWNRMPRNVPVNRTSDPHIRSNHYCLLSSKVSDKTKGALRSDLTKLYPALPMTSPLYNGYVILFYFEPEKHVYGFSR